MSEVLFYHLQRQPLEKVLPLLLNKTLERGWRALVRLGQRERVRPLSDAIWSWRDESFIPHGTAEDGHAEHQPIWLTKKQDNPTGAEVLFCAAGAAPADEELTAMERVIVMFSAHDPQAVEAARDLWRRYSKLEGLRMTYWRQDETGAWRKQAESGT